jgi:hypothetical protein
VVELENERVPERQRTATCRAEIPMAALTVAHSSRASPRMVCPCEIKSLQKHRSRTPLDAGFMCKE